MAGKDAISDTLKNKILRCPSSLTCESFVSLNNNVYRHINNRVVLCRWHLDDVVSDCLACHLIIGGLEKAGMDQIFRRYLTNGCCHLSLDSCVRHRIGNNEDR